MSSIRSSNPPHPYRVLAACDFTPESEKALRRAVAVADATRAELHVVYVEDPGTLGPTLLPDISATVMKRLRDLIDAMVPVTNQLAKITLHASLGPPAAEIAWLAANIDADLVVVGTHGRKGMSRLVLGSVAEKVARLAGCAVLVERGKQHDATTREPEIEPLCPRCAERRAATGGAELWCAEHGSHHLKMHMTTGEAPRRSTEVRPWGFSS
jgi:nucleotide-binding universal stress UspA family protein